MITGSGPKGGLVADELPSNVALVDRNVPISYLFEECALVVHTASSLYTGAALKFGVPSVCCPFVGEQRCNPTSHTPSLLVCARVPAFMSILVHRASVLHG